MIVDQFRSLLLPSNPVFTRARQGKWLPNIFAAIGVLALLIFLAFGSCAIVIKIATGDSEQIDRFMESTYGLIVPFLLLTALTLLWVRVVERRAPATLGLTRKDAWFSYLKGFAVGLVVMGVIVGGMALVGGVTVQTGGTLPTGKAALGVVLTLLIAYIIQGGTEELLFRGWFMQVLGARYRPWVGVLVSSVLFCAFHGSLRPTTIIHLLIVGLLLSFYCLREGSLWGICGIHSAWNWAQGNVFGLPVSGYEPTGGSLFDLQPTGNPLLTGGDYGPEGGLIGLVVLLAGSAVFVMTGKNGRDQSVESKP